ncbi:MAG: hypothetical protein HY669_02030 [Chloroflexi bacterium]|nr:hypothetical protein [Chloroflexota bacterium]
MWPFRKLWRRLETGLASEAGGQDAGPLTLDPLYSPATAKLASQLSAVSGIGPESGGKALSVPPTQSGQPAVPYPQEGGPAKGPLAGLEASAVAPVAEGVAAPEPEAANDPAVDDLIDLFTESAPVNEELQRLSMGLYEVDIRELAGECHDVVAQLKMRKQRVRTP